MISLSETGEENLKEDSERILYGVKDTLFLSAAGYSVLFFLFTLHYKVLLR